MAIFTKPSRQGGVDVVGTRITCDYQGSKDPAPLRLEGIVKSQRKIEGKGNLLTVETADGFRSIYFEKATNVYFSLLDSDPRKWGASLMGLDRHDTGEDYDAWKDGQLEKYGCRFSPRRRYR